MQPSNKTKGMEATLTQVFGFDRHDSIRGDRCVPPPIGCGQLITEGFKDRRSMDEYRISGLCQSCQDQLFEPEEWVSPEQFDEDYYQVDQEEEF